MRKVNSKLHMCWMYRPNNMSQPLNALYNNMTIGRFWADWQALNRTLDPINKVV